MSAVEYHDSSVWKGEESRIVVVVWLEVAAYEHFACGVCLEIDLCGFYASVNVNVSDVCGIGLVVLVMHGSRVGKPAPCTFVGDSVAVERILRC